MPAACVQQAPPLSSGSAFIRVPMPSSRPSASARVRTTAAPALYGAAGLAGCRGARRRSGPARRTTRGGRRAAGPRTSRSTPAAGRGGRYPSTNSRRRPGGSASCARSGRSRTPSRRCAKAPAGSCLRPSTSNAPPRRTSTRLSPHSSTCRRLSDPTSGRSRSWRHHAAARAGPGARRRLSYGRAAAGIYCRKFRHCFPRHLAPGRPIPDRNRSPHSTLSAVNWMNLPPQARHTGPTLSK
jgi:hypothetical protein